MGIKKQIGMGVASAALGLALVGGGTFAYFNDTETVNNSFAAGTLDLHVNKSQLFKLSNMKPGDSRSETFVLDNIGSLAIKEVWLTAQASGFNDGVVNNEIGTQGSSKNGFLKQFSIEIIKNENNVVVPGGHYTLYDLVYGKINSDNIDLLTTSTAPTPGLPIDPDDTEMITVNIKFKNNGNQNVFQGDSINILFGLRATQYDGQEVQDSDLIDKNGWDYIKTNEESNNGDPYTE